MADIKNLVKEVHCRTAHFLALSSDVIVMPRMECHNIAYNAGFPHKAGHPTLLLVQPEASTSKTCGACGRLNDRLGLQPDFLCPYQDCAYTTGRDHNGAYNMIIKAIR
ncbi:uncharacterized protein PAN0_002d1128 [Moesziomyces antarcticus]|uniref:Cas12f1-like TNB domain-containing protein n=1 Tax=Pseudozyma antarctica TaxID=84753 RepID=A0A5C3FHI5_PSEA2|nr:uncharacterized protein PAN0_002d1128 [Moesziomyces antarcticus]GAK62926.1 hypothetical protein PAN0_002d1128 [Moesziomyces antarcticus]SPO43596.1 uncharacterized protein PSANT_01281 [Moesziomyces antarcticus]